ncbi:Low-affinity potassium transport protein [Tolypocladium capitatum]|uniref:Low-affinity potassium transport protein n=1 Tax=Tolypocladium capitatum TaxID=45235 RepID=A0A2K3QED5_9HYPO|nr:Low-affinity potassium transport protein [Tolypocladium capitatum]
MDGASNPHAMKQPASISFHLSSEKPTPLESDADLCTLTPRERERAHPLMELNELDSRSKDDTGFFSSSVSGMRQCADGSEDIDAESLRGPPIASGSRSLPHGRPSAPMSVEKAVSVASSIFTPGSVHIERPPLPVYQTPQRMAADKVICLPQTATVGRDSRFCNLTCKDREELGGVEYRSLKLLLKIVTGKCL